VPPARFLPNGLELLALTGGLSLLALPRARSPERQSPLVPLLLTYVVIYLGAYALHPQAGNNARYLLFLEPPLSILAGLGYVRALDRSAIVSRAVRASAAILLAALVSARGHEYARLLGDTAIWGPSGRSQPRTSEVVAGFLRAHGIAYAMAEDYDLRWRIAFQTRETVQVFHLSSRWFSDPPLAIRGARHYALIVAAGNPTEQWMVASFARRGLSVPRRVVEGFAIYLCSPEIPCAGAPGSAPRKGSHGARRVGG
jgi:hypothetical protein